jgi:deoxyribodipyrimidine photo-lyase
MAKSIIWFRNDLRIKNNPALHDAVKNGEILAIYIYDSNEDIGQASKYWLHNSLKSLNKDLNNKLNFYSGKPLQILNKLIKKFDITNIYWNRCYDPYSIKRDSEIKTKIKKQKIEVNSYNGSLLFEPWEIKKGNDDFYKIFTPFYKSCITNHLQPNPPIKNQTPKKYINDKDSLNIDDLKLLPKKDWYKKFDKIWNISEKSAHKKLDDFIKNKLSNYKNGRDFPALNSVSELSPYLHFGLISPHQVFHKINSLRKSEQTEHFIRELIWREFSYYQLYHQPQIINRNLRPKFNNFKWANSDKLLQSWQQGKTGIPIVDAGMRQLWQTGYMHNRVRMIVGSFLVKNLRLHWKHGAEWFYDKLLDADIASNSASWQWVAGTGIDSSPYFRIFNPITQSQKFDKDGEYIRKYVPELSKLPNKYLFEPYITPDDILKKCNIKMGETYPMPVVDLKESRKKALDCFKKI